MQRFEKYGRLTALEDHGDRWLFRCDCGTEKVIYWRNVKTGKSQSCGCLQKERTSAAKRTHGHSRGGKISPEYQAYRSMMSRCYRPSNNRYEEYGGRGIAVCDWWRESFGHFLADMGSRPSPKHSIDRILNDGDYEPSNCQWATKKAQSRNRRSTLIIRVGGFDVALSEAAEKFGLRYTTLKARIFKHGWPPDKAVATPIRKKVA